jgi:hypothetical protein
VAGFNHFATIADAFPQVCAQIVSKTAIDCQGNIQGFIRANGQIDTGFMLGSVHVEDGPNEQTKFVVCGAFYGIFQNYGTRYMPGKPFWEPGIEQTRPGFNAACAALESRLPH